YKCWQQLKEELKKEKILICKYLDLGKKEKRYIENYFNTTIYPVLTPITLDPVKPFPHITNRSLNLLISLKYKKENKLINTNELSFTKDSTENRNNYYQIALVQVPANLPRIIDIPTTDNKRFVFIEEIIKNNLEKLFTG